MNNIKNNKFFLLIGLKQITFAALNESNHILLDENLLTNDLTLQENFRSLENFLDRNIFSLEKKLNYHIKEINLIINYEDFLTIDVSTINNFNNFNNNINQLDNVSNFLVNIKDSVIKDRYEYDLVHMLINKFIIDGKEFHSIPDNNSQNNILFEIKFICLKTVILKNLKTFFSKYEIFINKISCYKYVDAFKNTSADNIFDLADKLSNGHNPKEILFIKKSPKNTGFFENFFNFFN